MKKFLQKIEEDMQTHKPVVMAFGRMNPPTIGHEKLVNRVQQIAHDYNAPHHIIISHSVDAKKNPLDVKRKLLHAKRFFPGANIEASSKEMPTFLQHAARLHAMGHDHLVMVAGSDRIPEYEKKLHQYNGEGPGKLYNFKKIEVKSAGHRDPDADGAEGMSASKMREHANSGDFASFRQGIPSHVPEKHAKELFRDVRKGMGIQESANHGMFKAIFVSGGPGSGKDIVIREAIAEQNAVEITSTTAISILNDKHKLYEFSRDTRREAIRQRQPLIITGTTNEQYNIIAIREELEELGYETMMVFVNTSNESSRKRNEGHERMMAESVRKERWEVTQLVAEKFNQEFKKYLEFDNSVDLNESTEFETSEKEEDISIIYEMSNWFFDTPVENEIAESWMTRHKKHNINKMFENFITKPTLEKGYKKYVSETKTNSKTSNAKTGTCSCGSTKGLFTDNICPSCELVRRQGKPDDIKDGGITSNSGYTFRTYESSGDNRFESSEPKVKNYPAPKESNFSQDKETKKLKKFGDRSGKEARLGNPSGLGSEWNTRTNGSGLTGGAGLGNQTYSESQDYSNANPASTAFPSGGSVNPLSSEYEPKKKGFKKFRKEAIDSPGEVAMGVAGVLMGATNKEPMETYASKKNNIII